MLAWLYCLGAVEQDPLSTVLANQAGVLPHLLFIAAAFTLAGVDGVGHEASFVQHQSSAQILQHVSVSWTQAQTCQSYTILIFPLRNLAKKNNNKILKGCLVEQKAVFPHSPNSPLTKNLTPFSKVSISSGPVLYFASFHYAHKNTVNVKSVCSAVFCTVRWKNSKRKKQQLFLGHAEVSQRILTRIKCTLGTIKIGSSQALKHPLLWYKDI